MPYIIITVLVCIICGFWNKSIRTKKGYNNGFALGFLFGIFAVIYSAGLPDLLIEQRIKNLEKELRLKVDEINNIIKNDIQVKSEQTDEEKESSNNEDAVVPINLSDEKVKCPLCGFTQPSKRSCCFKCGVKFNE